MTRQLEDDEIAELIEVIFENDFFNLPIRFTDTEYPPRSGVTSTFITITHDGINYITGGVGDGTEESRRFAAIANFIERMANETEVHIFTDRRISA